VSFKNSKRSPLGALCLSHGGFFKPGGKPGIVAVPTFEVVPTPDDPSKVATGPHMAAAAFNFGAGAGGLTPFSFAIRTSSSNASTFCNRSNSSASSSFPTSSLALAHKRFFIVLVFDDVFNDDDDGIDVRNQARLLPFSFSMCSFREVPNVGEGVDDDDDDDDDDDAGCWRASRRR
jgi:hypothetical protein